MRLLTVLLAALSLAGPASAALPPNRTTLDRNTRDFLRPLRDCAQGGRALLRVLNAARGADIESSLLGFAGPTREICQEDRSDALATSTAGFKVAAKLGIRVFTLYFSALRAFEDSVHYNSKTLLQQSRDQFTTAWTAYKRAVTALNTARAHDALGPLPLILR
jgi:hypothetical protein